MELERIKEIRESNNLKQKDIANILGIARSTYSSYEIPRDTIPINHLNNLCNYFDISIDYALGLTEIRKYPGMRKEIDKELLLIRIKNLRKINKITQNEIANFLNIARSTWTGYESGKFQIPTLSLYAIAKKYHTSIDYLLGKIDTN